MKNKASVWCYICAVISYLVGAVYCCSFIFIPIAIYCFIYGNRYIKFAKITDSEFAIVRGFLTSSAIFLSIAGFPIGLLSIIPAYMAGSNNVKIKNADAKQDYKNTTSADEQQTVKPETIIVSDSTLGTEDNNSVSSEDLDKLEKLAKFRAQGLLTEEEFNEAKRQLIDKN